MNDRYVLSEKSYNQEPALKTEHNDAVQEFVDSPFNVSRPFITPAGSHREDDIHVERRAKERRAKSMESREVPADSYRQGTLAPRLSTVSDRVSNIDQRWRNLREDPDEEKGEDECDQQ